MDRGSFVASLWLSGNPKKIVIAPAPELVKTGDDYIPEDIELK